MRHGFARRGGGEDTQGRRPVGCAQADRASDDAPALALRGILRTIESNRVVTGVTWVDGELWHGTWEGDQSDIRQIDLESGKVLARLTMPEGVGVSGLESDGADLFYPGGGPSGKVRAVRRPKRMR
jgi:hypothetical protein